MRGYKDLSFYKQTEIIHDFTMEFCVKYIDYKSRTKDQMEQAARSGKQNISEGYAQQDIFSKIKLLKVARGSLEELLNDYQDYLRQNGLELWEKDYHQAAAARSLVYKIKDYKNYNAYNLYKIYLEDRKEAANVMICLINQTNAMMNRKINWLETGISKENAMSRRERWLNVKMNKEREREKEFKIWLQEKVKNLGQ